MPLAVLPFLPLHLGSLHPVEQALTLLLAFGPFVVLGLVIRRQRRQDDQAERESSTPDAPDQRAR